MKGVLGNYYGRFGAVHTCRTNRATNLDLQPPYLPEAIAGGEDTDDGNLARSRSISR